ncbi:hypothetical protein Q8F55_009271 [Vanrija albida]|uniref:Protein CPL1-like domain-containing protein n=1 Tax=Vanrija albida TaxID=181172 RepID=A0ABR3PTF5_9TREE
MLPLILLTLAAIPLALAESVWIACTQDPAYNIRSTRPTSLACDSYCHTFDYVFWDQGSLECRCSNTPVPIQDMVGSTNLGGSCPAGRFNVRAIQSQYGTFKQCLSNDNGVVNPIVLPDIPTVAECWNQCAIRGPTTYASYKASGGRLECQCFNSFTGNPTTCGAGSIYVWQYGPNVVVSDLARRRRNRAAAAQEALAQAAPHCPLGLAACRVSALLDPHASYECINPLAELESCGGCVHGGVGEDSPYANASGVDCTTLPGTSRTGVMCDAGRCRAWQCESGYRVVDGVCVAK